jgi:hypothetical protein
VKTERTAKDSGKEIRQVEENKRQVKVEKEEFA